MGSGLGISREKLLAVVETPVPDMFDEVERLVLEYADRMTLSDRDVDDAFFERLRQHFDDDAIVELTETIAWENASSKFNRAMRIPSQGLWKQQ